jgi:anaerobic selenocysteine-containing dehydrogenase
MSKQVVRGACRHDCPDTCGWVVEVEDGTAARLYGDPGHPFTRGTLCAKVDHYLERVYHPDRVLRPLKRAGGKGDGRFVRVSWDDALTDIGEREVFAHLISGQLNKQIAFDLGISERTTKIHRHQVLAKIDADSIADLVRRADDLRTLPIGTVM